jgi:hypothetical protein
VQGDFENIIDSLTDRSAVVLYADPSRRSEVEENYKNCCFQRGALCGITGDNLNLRASRHDINLNNILDIIPLDNLRPKRRDLLKPPMAVEWFSFGFCNKDNSKSMHVAHTDPVFAYLAVPNDEPAYLSSIQKIFPGMHLSVRGWEEH